MRMRGVSRMFPKLVRNRWRWQKRDERMKRKIFNVASSATILTGTSMACSAAGKDEDNNNTTTLLAVGAVLGLGAIFAASQWVGGSSINGDEGAVKKAENALKSRRYDRAERIARNILKQKDVNNIVRADAYSILAAVLLQTDRAFESLDAIESSIEARLSDENVKSDNKIDRESIRKEREALIETLKCVGIESGAAKQAGCTYAKTVDMFGERGDKSGGVKSLGRALAVSTLIENHPDELKTNVLEGMLHRLLHSSRKDPKDEAEAFLDAVRNVAIGYGYEHPTVALVSRDAANALYRAGDQDTARALLTSAMEIQDKVLEMSDPARAQTLKQLGEFMLYVDKKPRDAIKYLKDAVTLLTMQYGSGHPHVDQARDLLRKAQDEAYKM